MQVRVAARIVAIALAGLGYVALNHWLMTQPEASGWNVVVVLAPMLLLVAIGAWRAGHRWVGLLAGAAIAGLCVQALRGVTVSSHVLYLSQHVGFNLFLAAVFGVTMRKGHTSLITTLAMRVHARPLSAGHIAYTRQVNAAWVIFFVGLVVVSLGLYAFASFGTWAVFANIVTPIATGALFVGEYLIRYRLHPEFDRTTVAEAIRAYRNHGQAERSAQ